MMWQQLQMAILRWERRETSDKGEVKEFGGGRTNFASTPAGLFPPVDFTSLATKRCCPQNVSVLAVAPQSQGLRPLDNHI